MDHYKFHSNNEFLFTLLAGNELPGLIFYLSTKEIEWAKINVCPAHY